MKRLTLAVKTLLACAAVGLAASCSQETSNTPAAAPAQTAASLEAPASCRIAYFDADSVMSAYTLARELTEEGQRQMNRFQQQATSKQRELENLAAQIEHKRQNSIYLSEASFQADVQNLQNRQAEAERQLNAQQTQLQATMAQAQTRLNDSINNCVRDLNAVLGYDAILFKESGIYFNPALDITAYIIEALNARYTAANPGVAPQ